MTSKAIIRRFIPDLVSAVKEEEQYDWYSGGHFMFYKITCASSTESYTVCLLKVTDFVPEPFRGSGAVEAIEDYSGLDVVGCFLVGSGELLRRDDERLVDGQLPKGFEGEAVFRNSDAPYYLYLLR